MTAKNVRSKAHSTYKSTKRSTKRIVNSRGAHEMKGRAKRATDSLKRGAKRVIGSPKVKEKGNDLVKSTREFASALYSAARGNDSEEDGLRRGSHNAKS